MWDELEKFSKSKKSPIGYEVHISDIKYLSFLKVTSNSYVKIHLFFHHSFQPFIEQCLIHNKEKEAKKYLPKVRNELKVKYLIKLK